MLANQLTSSLLFMSLFLLAACNPNDEINEKVDNPEPINESTYKDDYLEITDIAARTKPISRPHVIRQYDMEYGDTVFDFFVQKSTTNSPNDDKVIVAATRSILDIARMVYSIKIDRVCDGIANSYQLNFEYDDGDEMSEIFLEEFLKSMFIADCSGEVQKVSDMLPLEE